MSDTTSSPDWSRHPDDGPLFPCYECGRARDENRCIYCSWQAQARAIGALQAEVARLRLAGDDVAAVLQQNPPGVLPTGAALDAAMQQWETALGAWEAARRAG